MKGTVKWFSEAKGFGFISPDEGGRDLYFQRGSLSTPDHTLTEGQRVEFEVTKGTKGPEAIEIHIVE